MRVSIDDSTGTPLNIRKAAADDWATVLYYEISNYAGAKYGINEDILVDPAATGTLTINGDVPGVTPVVNGDATTAVETYNSFLYGYSTTVGTSMIYKYNQTSQTLDPSGPYYVSNLKEIFQIIELSSGRFICLAQETTLDKVCIAISDDGGVTWTIKLLGPVLTSSSPVLYAKWILVDRGDGYIFSCWNGYSDGTCFAVLSSDDGDTFTASALTIGGNDVTYVHGPYVFLDGSIGILAHDDRDSKAYWLYSSNDGTSWATTLMGSAVATGLAFSFSVDSSENIVAIYGNTLASSIKYDSSTFGSSWNTVTIDPTGDRYVSAKMWRNSGDTMFAVHDFGTGLSGVAYSDDGLAWSTATGLGTGVGLTEYYPTMHNYATVDDSFITVGWYGTLVKIVSTTDGGKTWSQDYTLPATSGGNALRFLGALIR
jgi:hypothetical protein